MKKFLSILLILSLCSAFVFADEEGDEYDDGYVYEANGAGDQTMRVELGGFFPINFNNQLKVGAVASVTYFQFLNSTFAIGGGLTLSTNLTVGDKSFITIPITFDAMYQPTIGKLEFPLVLSVGGSIHTMAGITYFPALTVKGSAGAFYRISETWSAGLTGTVMWSPEWLKEKSKNYNGVFVFANASVRFHF